MREAVMGDVLSKIVEWVTTDPATAVGMVHAMTLLLLAATPVAAVVVAGYAVHVLNTGRQKGRTK